MQPLSLVKTALLSMADGKIELHDYTHIPTHAFRMILEKNPYMITKMPGLLELPGYSSNRATPKMKDVFRFK